MKIVCGPNCPAAKGRNLEIGRPPGAFSLPGAWAVMGPAQEPLHILLLLFIPLFLGIVLVFSRILRQTWGAKVRGDSRQITCEQGTTFEGS